MPAARRAPQPADSLGAGPAADSRGGVVVVDGCRRDVVVAGGRWDALVEDIVLDASVVGTTACAVFGPGPAVRVWGPLHAETANSNAIAPAQRRRHTVLSIPGWRDRVHGTLTFHDIAWHYDESDDQAHVTTNIGPAVFRS